MYPYDIDPRSYINSALALQPQVAPSFPQMTPASRGYFGPAHETLSNTLRAALAQQATNAGLFASPTPDQMGLLSPTTTTPMTNSFFRMDPNFANPVYVASNTPTTAAPSTGVSNTAQSSSGNHNSTSGGLGYNDTYTRSNGPVGDTLFATGPYSNGGGAGWSFNDGGPFSPVGGIFSGLFGSTPTSIDAPGADTKTADAAPAAAPTYRLSSNDLMGGLGRQPSITGTPLPAPSVPSAYDPNYSRVDYNLAGNADLIPSYNSDVGTIGANNAYGLLGPSQMDMNPNGAVGYTLNGYGPNPYAMPGYNSSYGNYAFANPGYSDFNGLLNSSVSDVTGNTEGGYGGDSNGGDN